MTLEASCNLPCPLFQLQADILLNCFHLKAALLCPSGLFAPLILVDFVTSERDPTWEEIAQDGLQLQGWNFGGERRATERKCLQVWQNRQRAQHQQGLQGIAVQTQVLELAKMPDAIQVADIVVPKIQAFQVCAAD